MLYFYENKAILLNEQQEAHFFLSTLSSTGKKKRRKQIRTEVYALSLELIILKESSDVTEKINYLSEVIHRHVDKFGAYNICL